uniref:Uncharacterized protein n=1 Tax=Triticum urartu TaxID=4572 RepID=A0A8R7TCP5_TRIUA
MCRPNDSQVDYVVRQCLHWPDGTRKKLLKSEPIDAIRDHKRQLAQALVDKYNDYLVVALSHSFPPLLYVLHGCNASYCLIHVTIN